MKNLYAITFHHYSQEDNEGGIKNMIIGSQEEMEKYFNKEYGEDAVDYAIDYENEYKDKEDRRGEENIYKYLHEVIRDNQNIDYPTFRDDDETFGDYEDLYYGETFFGYKLLRTDISDNFIEEMKGIENFIILNN